MNEIFFIDRCLGKKLADSLRNVGATVEIHDDHFSQDIFDIEIDKRSPPRRTKRKCLFCFVRWVYLAGIKP